MHICTECGRVHQEDLDFCPHCGSTKGGNVDPELIPPEFKIVNGPKGAYVVRQDVRRIRLALALALIPGVFDIFGLGHLLLGKYFRGLWYLCCSGIVYYERFTGYFGVESTYMFVITLALLIIQLFDIFHVIRKEYGII